MWCVPYKLVGAKNYWNYKLPENLHSNVSLKEVRKNLL